MWREIIDEIKLDYKVSKENEEREKEELEKAKRAGEAALEALDIARGIAVEVQNKAFQTIEDIVNRCLETSFDDPYTFKMEFKERRNKTEVDLVFYKDGNKIDPVSASGGGVIDIASFALRLACLILKSKDEKVLILDEPFKFVSADIRPRIASLLKELSSEIGIQIIIVTHLPEMEVGKVIDVEKE